MLYLPQLQEFFLRRSKGTVESGWPLNLLNCFLLGYGAILSPEGRSDI
jgi:hypothetical protein